MTDFLKPPAPPDTEHATWAWDCGTERWLSTPTLAAHRAAAWDRIKAARAAAQHAPITVDGRTYDADPASQQRIAGASTRCRRPPASALVAA